MSARLSLAMIAAAAGAMGLAALAQTVDGLDIAAIRQRSAETEADARDFAAHVKDRGQAFAEDATAIHGQGLDNLQRVASGAPPAKPSGAIDFDALIAGAAQNARAPQSDAPLLMVFASLSMPQASLRQLVADTARAGGVVVFRGFPGNSVKAFTAAISRIVDRQEQYATIGIDPRLFRAFNIEAVPTYVAAASDFDLCSGSTCRTVVPPHDRMTGNVTVAYALTSFAEGRGPGAAVAARALANMAKTTP